MFCRIVKTDGGFMEKELIDKLLKLAEDVADVYQKIMVAEVHHQAREVNVYQNQLNFILDFENSLYKRINEHNVEEYKEYLEKICPDITLDILNALFCSLYFSKNLRVYSRLCFLRDSYYMSNETTTKDYIQICAYNFLEKKSLSSSALLFLDSFIKENNPFKEYIRVKYNLIYSFYEAFLVQEDFKEQGKYALYPKQNVLVFYGFQPEAFYVSLSRDASYIIEGICDDIEDRSFEEFESDIDFGEFEKCTLSLVIRVFSFLIQSYEILEYVKTRLSNSIPHVHPKVAFVYQDLLDYLETDFLLKQNSEEEHLSL